MNRYWWIRHDYLTYKVPVHEGKVMLPHDFLVPGYQPNPSEQWYSFVHGRRDRRKRADFSGLDDAMFFVSEPVRQVFVDMFQRHGRTYPVRTNVETHHLVFIDTVLSAFDLSRSDYATTGEPGHVEDHISRFFRVTLRDGFDTDADIFRLDGIFALRATLIVSERFKARYELHGLTGLHFRPTDGSDALPRPNIVLGSGSPPALRH